MKRNASAPNAGMPSGNSFLVCAVTFGLVSGRRQSGGAFFQQAREVDSIDQIHRIDDVALTLAHLLAFGIAHRAVDVHGFERHFAGEIGGHHNHARHPEENNFAAGDENV